MSMVFLGFVSVTSYAGNLGQLRWCILLVSISLVICSDSSSLASKLRTNEPNTDDSDRRLCTSKYIMKSYYEKYVILDDSDYKDFTRQQLPCGLCDLRLENTDLVPRLLALERKLVGEGSHRHLSSSIRMSLQLHTGPELSRHNCTVIVIERLPSGVFADPFELQHLLERGVFNDIAVFGDTNLESPSFLSNRSAVEIHMDVSPNIKYDIEIELKVPLHARYAPLTETGYSQVRFGAPDLLLRCSIEGNSRNRSCLYTMDNNGSESQSGQILWKIPSGTKAHAGIVYVFTFISTSLAALLIVLTSISHSSINKCKSSKQS